MQSPDPLTFSGRPVWEDALHFVVPGKNDLNFFGLPSPRSAFSALARPGSTRSSARVSGRRDRGRAGVVLLVRPGKRVTRRSSSTAGMVPATPAFLVVVVAALLAVARLTGAFKPVARRARRRTDDDRGAPGWTGFVGDTGDSAGCPAARLFTAARPLRRSGSTGTSGARLLVVRLRPSREPARPLPRVARSRARLRRRRLV